MTTFWERTAHTSMLCSLCLFVLLIVILNISKLAFEMGFGDIIASVPDHCLSSKFNGERFVQALCL